MKSSPAIVAEIILNGTFQLWRLRTIDPSETVMARRSFSEETWGEKRRGDSGEIDENLLDGQFNEVRKFLQESREHAGVGASWQ